METGIYGFKMKTLEGKEKSLADYKGKTLLIVNVASNCGNTPQYKGLQEIYDKHKAKGLVVLGFPANNFGSQEPGTDGEIKDFCDRNYQVTFDMFSKIDVKGEGAHPLYKYLTTQGPDPGAIGWNFAKFLVSKDGKILRRFSPSTKPDDKELVAAIETAL